MIEVEQDVNDVSKTVSEVDVPMSSEIEQKPIDVKNEEEKGETSKGWLKIPHEEARAWGWYDEIEHFAAVLLDGAKPITTGEDGLAALKIVMAAYESAKTHQRIALNL